MHIVACTVVYTVRLGRVMLESFIFYQPIGVYTVGWLENQNFGKQFALRLEFRIDDEKTPQANFQVIRRTFRVSADHWKFTCMN